MDYAEYLVRKAQLTPGQRRRIAAKAQWEGCSWLYVARNWPELFGVKEPKAASGVRS